MSQGPRGSEYSVARQPGRTEAKAHEHITRLGAGAAIDLLAAFVESAHMESYAL